jgi:hypothetical protein
LDAIDQRAIAGLPRADVFNDLAQPRQDLARRFIAIEFVDGQPLEFPPAFPVH